MPFITKDRREAFAHGWNPGMGPIQPGDLCYVHYKEMVDTWKANPRWATAHKIYKRQEWLWDHKQHINIPDDDRVAARLAWQVFFQLHVMPYELKKREENGDI